MPVLVRVFNTRQNNAYFGFSVEGTERYKRHKESCDHEMQACAAWFALHSIPPEKRAALGVDLSDAPGINHSITLPLQPEISQVLRAHDKMEDRYARGDSTIAFASKLCEISGRIVQRGGEIPPFIYEEQILPGTSMKDMLIMDQLSYGDKRSMPSGILVEEVKRTAPAIRRIVDADQQGYSSQSSIPHERSAARMRTVEEVPGRSSIIPVAKVEADKNFIEFYTNPDLVAALKTHQVDMVVAEDTPHATRGNRGV